MEFYIITININLHMGIATYLCYIVQGWYIITRPITLYVLQSVALDILPSSCAVYSFRDERLMHSIQSNNCPHIDTVSSQGWKSVSSETIRNAGEFIKLGSNKPFPLVHISFMQINILI